MIQIVGPKDKPLYKVINTTSSSNNWSKFLSPFYIGPIHINLYHPECSFSKNMENAWQFSKVYKEFVDENNNPTEEYYKWAKKGFDDNWAHRYPMGKNKKPLYALFNDNKLDYIDSRKSIYIPYYVQGVVKTDAFQQLKIEYEKEGNLSLFDYDGYDNINLKWDDIINNPNKKMGHGFVLGMLLDKFI